MLTPILQAYGLEPDQCVIEAFGSGLINNTWRIRHAENDYILQRINQNVFKVPEAIAFNIEMMGKHFKEFHPDYLFVFPEKTVQQQEIVYHNGGYFRLFPFIKNSHTIDVVLSPHQAYEAAHQFGKFTAFLTDVPVDDLRITLPDFHNLTLRYQQFEEALEKGNRDRMPGAMETIEFLRQQKGIAEEFEKIKANPNFKLRVTHHDTKISNVLFDENDKGLCVIDLDTVMPGYFISDVGDMMRTYLSPVSEEEKDFEKIEIRHSFFKAIVTGYSQAMKDELSADEKKRFVYAGKFMIYMQAMRFLTDYLNNDVYYGSRYEGHNLVRANNQVALLKRLLENEEVLNNEIDQHLTAIA